MPSLHSPAPRLSSHPVCSEPPASCAPAADKACGEGRAACVVTPTPGERQPAPRHVTRPTSALASPYDGPEVGDAKGRENKADEEEKQVHSSCRPSVTPTRPRSASAAPENLKRIPEWANTAAILSQAFRSCWSRRGGWLWGLASAAATTGEGLAGACPVNPATARLADGQRFNDRMVWGFHDTCQGPERGGSVSFPRRHAGGRP